MKRIYVRVLKENIAKDKYLDYLTIPAEFEDKEYLSSQRQRDVLEDSMYAQISYKVNLMTCEVHSDIIAIFRDKYLCWIPQCEDGDVLVWKQHCAETFLCIHMMEIIDKSQQKE